jgi:hypothetical protein
LRHEAASDVQVSSYSSDNTSMTPSRGALPALFLFLLLAPAVSGATTEAAAGSTFVGSSTSGANGNVTDVAVPGGHFITFTGMDVRHGDGRQLQRVGIVPHVPVPRTVANIAAGVDEVLEKALELARQP